MCVCVFTLSCFLAKYVFHSLIVVRYIKEREVPRCTKLKCF